MKTTGLSRVSKDLIIKEIEKELKSRPTFFVTQHGTVSATTLDKLRAKLRLSNSRYLAVKGSLGRKALQNSDLKEVSEKLEGACGITFTSGDIVLSSKALVDFAKENEGFKIQTGYMNGQVVSADQIKTLASLPSKEVLLARVVGGMQAPISRFVGVLSGTVRKVVTVLDAIAKKKGSA
jgi:large subunit ribosomal protein L10